MKVLKFQATWCQPCKMLSKVIESAKDKITLPIEEIDIDENTEMARQYSVRGVPTIVVVDDTGATIRTKVGFMNEKELLGFING